MPPAAAALNTAGIEALARGDLETADARLSLALEYSPRFVEALVNLGLVELERGNFGRARTLFERARRINPDVAQPHHALGVLEERARRPDLASEHYYEALRVDPGFAAARDNLARLLFAGGFVEEALVQYRRLVELEPHDARAAAGLIETLVRLQRLSEADAALASALVQSPSAPELGLLDARRLARAGRFDAAERTLLPLTERHDELAAAALGFYAACELAERRPEEAVVAARRALSLEPEQGVATYTLALALAALSSPEAPAWLRRARRALPNDPGLRELDASPSQK
ncbi:MAG TPA: tetratricopeptide repeat protein [Polyangiaceae bacterium]|nr:tetratricopeptide repeat protein [Polyangiaceae bacterium]